MKRVVRNLGKSERADLANLMNRVKKKDYTGSSGRMIKNSFYQIMITAVSKVGALAFTMILARILFPEDFGIYSLAMSTVVLIASISDLGIDNTMSIFVSKYLNKHQNKKAKSYLFYLSKIKFAIIGLGILIIALSSHFLASEYYHKPIFLALIAGLLYLPLSSLNKYFESVYIAKNNFRVPLIKEIFFQLSRVLIVPLLTLFFIRSQVTDQHLIMLVILLLSFCYLISTFYMVFRSRDALEFMYLEEAKPLTKQEKKRALLVALPLVTMIFSGVLFGQIDILMLGRYVPEAYIGFYNAAFSLVSSGMAILSFGAMAIFPILSSLKKEELERLLSKTFKYSIVISLLTAIFVIYFSDLIITLIFGPAFLPASLYLKILSLFLVTGTITAIYNSYFLIREKTHILAGLLILTLLINIILNYFFIQWGLQYNFNLAVVGVCISTLLSKLCYLAGLKILR